MARELPADDVIGLVKTRAHLEFDRAQLMTERMTPEKRQAELTDVDAAIAEVAEVAEVAEEQSASRIRGRLVNCRDGKKVISRSTKRRDDVEELPWLQVDDRTVGRTYTAKDGKTYRPSTLLTITLGSYGQVHTGARTRRGRLVLCECGTLHGQRDPLPGTPIDPDSYDYRQAAVDAVHFAVSDLGMRSEVVRLAHEAQRPPGTSYPGGADDAEIAGLQRAVALSLPADLVDWLRVCKGDLIGPGGLYGVRYSPNVTDIASALDWFPNWRERGWLPVAGDGNGDYYVLLTGGELSGCIGFVDQADIDAIDHVAATKPVDLPVVPAAQGSR